MKNQSGEKKKVALPWFKIYPTIYRPLLQNPCRFLRVKQPLQKTDCRAASWFYELFRLALTTPNPIPSPTPLMFSRSLCYFITEA